MRRGIPVGDPRTAAPAAPPADTRHRPVVLHVAPRRSGPRRRPAILTVELGVCLALISVLTVALAGAWAGWRVAASAPGTGIEALEPTVPRSPAAEPEERSAPASPLPAPATPPAPAAEGSPVPVPPSPVAARNPGARGTVAARSSGAVPAPPAHEIAAVEGLPTVVEAAPGDLPLSEPATTPTVPLVPAQPAPAQPLAEDDAQIEDRPTEGTQLAGDGTEDGLTEEDGPDGRRTDDELTDDDQPAADEDDEDDDGATGEPTSDEEG